MEEAEYLRALTSMLDGAPTYTGLIQEEDSSKPMPTLTDEIKTFIVKGLACFDTPSKVAEDVKVTFGVALARQHVHHYDPASTQPPAERWCALHAATRRAFLEEIAEIGISHRAVRLRMLDRIAHRAEERQILDWTAHFVELAAKECGGFYERRRRDLSPPPAKEE